MHEILSKDEQRTLQPDLESVHEFKLITGQFTPEEAKELLMCLINDKLSFHSKKNLRSIEHTGQVNHQSEKRIEELEEMRLAVLDLINKIERSGQNVKVYSDLRIEVIPDSH